MITQGEAKPRWEWRTFDTSLNAIEGRIAGALEHVAPHTSAEIYLLRLGGPQNAKIRDGILDVKRLQQVDVNGLELWEPVLKAKFPLSLRQHRNGARNSRGNRTLSACHGCERGRVRGR